MSFDGFPKETLSFLKDLNADNTRDWFEAHRQDYRDYYLTPALELIEALAPLAENLNPPHKAEARLNGSLRRINRDTRFSKDKTPYQPRIHIVFWTGDHPNRSAGIHLVLAHDQFGFGAGHWAFEKDALQRYRESVTRPDPLKALHSAVRSAEEIGCVLGKPELARIPRGFDANAMTDEWLRRKGLVARTHDAMGHDNALFSAAATDYLADLMKALAPIDRWIFEYVYT